MTIFAKRMSHFSSLKALLAALLLISVLSACDKKRNKPGYSYFPDMEQSQAYETYSANPVWADGKTNQLPPEGVVPREMIPYNFEKTEINRIWAGQELSNPYADDASVLKEGKRMYDIYCMHCHGDKGDGNGHLYTSQKYLFMPANLLSEKIRTNPDGEMFHVITVGFGVMGPHGAQIQPDDRWKIISYIREDLHTRKDTMTESTEVNVVKREDDAPV